MNQKAPAKSENPQDEISVVSQDPNYQHQALDGFSQDDFPSPFLNIFDKLGFTAPTPIQANSIPVLLEHRDVVGIAKTGSGKTLAFILPALISILENKRGVKEANQRWDNRNSPRALVLAPTRELAMQIFNSALQFARSVRLDICVIYGGASQWTQKNELSRGCDLLIATPGRLLDFLNQRVVYLDYVSFYVLDEADRMLDMGFIPQVQQITDHVKKERQTVLFSATWPKEVERLSRDICTNQPVTISVGTDELTINKDINQKIIVLDERQKRDEIFTLLDGLSVSKQSKILIFAKTKKGCEFLSDDLQRSGYQAIAIHGDKPQKTRDRIIKDYKRGYRNILVATDVASRGLDIKDIKVVINYDFPMTIEDYIHRIGRTGRAGNTGSSYTFFTMDDGNFSKDLVTILTKSGQVVPDELIDLMHSSRHRHGKKKFGRYGRGGGGYNRRGYGGGGGGGGFFGGGNRRDGGGGGGGFYSRGGAGGGSLKAYQASKGGDGPRGGQGGGRGGRDEGFGGGRSGGRGRGGYGGGDNFRGDRNMDSGGFWDSNNGRGGGGGGNGGGQGNYNQMEGRDNRGGHDDQGSMFNFRNRQNNSGGGYRGRGGRGGRGGGGHRGGQGGFGYQQEGGFQSNMGTRGKFQGGRSSQNRGSFDGQNQ